MYLLHDDCNGNALSTEVVVREPAVIDSGRAKLHGQFFSDRIHRGVPMIQK